MTVHTFYDANGTLLRTDSYDLDAGTVATTLTGQASTVAAIPPDVLVDMLASRASDARRQRLNTAAATLRQWAADAAATTGVSSMTVAQHKNVTQTVVTRLGIFFDRFADLLDER